MRTPMELKNFKVANDSITSLDYTEECNGMNSFESKLSAACNEIMAEVNESYENMKIKENKVETAFLETNFDYVKDVLQTPMFQHIQHKKDPRSPTVGLKRTPIVFSDAENLEIPDNNDDKESFEEAVVVVTEKIKESIPSKSVSNKIIAPKMNTQKIYEDGENINLSTPKKTSSDFGVRTPLSCVANTKHMRSKLAFEPKSVSKVPVLIKRQIN